MFWFAQHTSKNEVPGLISLFWEAKKLKNNNSKQVRNFAELRNFAWHQATAVVVWCKDVVAQGYVLKSFNGTEAFHFA